MKEIKSLDKIYLKDFDVYVNQYLTYAQIQQIINSTLKLESWAERQQNIDMLVLYHVTNITSEELENIGHDTILQSGLLDEVYKIIKNIDQIYKGIDYSESLKFALSALSKKMPELIKEIKKQVK